ncbi:uncharacterized protein LOC113519778 [Galleria mellonella]|uniref:Uncharacterized protein LOC113519778 n=1 Tax=Galleria mellonella TaxID=7137 RepID=A0A6J1WWN7_GALME|nr:uncharacterized protein LOC113519778 [Galleria mellonella]
MNCKNILFYGIILLQSAVGIRINFTTCQNSEWNCVNNLPNEIVYTCSLVRSNNFIIHLKDYYTDHIKSVTVQNCRDIRVVLDCPILQRPSQLQRFKIKDCDRLEFVSLSTNSLLQTPPEVTIENVREIVSFPRQLFKSPITNTELKCSGSSSLKKIRILNSKINTIKTRAIYNVTGIKSIEFQNVTISNIENQAIETIMGNDNTVFSIISSNIDNVNSKGIVIQCASATIADNVFGDIMANVINITCDYLRVTGNKFKTITGLVFNSANINISNNDIDSLKSTALAAVKCSKKRARKKQFNFSSNRIKHVEPNSLLFDYNSCKSAAATVIFSQNKIDCKCRNIAFLNSVSSNRELSNIILDVTSNNTCLHVPCLLPVDIVKLLQESDMCQLSLDNKVMCLLYNDKHSKNNEVTTDEEITVPPPTFYLIRQANLNDGDASAPMTAVDKDDLLKDSHLNMTNRTTVKIVFDSSRDFVETLRSTGTNRARKVEVHDPSTKNEYTSRNRNTVAHDKQKALDFYKYVYAQLRSPKPNENKKRN